MTLPETQPPTTLASTQAAFRQSPSRQTALAFMDAAIGEWEGVMGLLDVDYGFHDRMQEIRGWLMNERTP